MALKYCCQKFLLIHIPALLRLSACTVPVLACCASLCLLTRLLVRRLVERGPEPHASINSQKAGDHDFYQDFRSRSCLPTAQRIPSLNMRYALSPFSTRPSFENMALVTTTIPAPQEQEIQSGLPLFLLKSGIRFPARKSDRMPERRSMRATSGTPYRRTGLSQSAAFAEMT